MTAPSIRKAVASAALVFASAAMAQDTQIAQIQKDVAEFNGRQFTYQIIENGAGPQSRLVTGSPYSADEKTTTTQTLADGNRIVNTTSAKLYRDQQGRTRVERSLKGAAPDGGGSEKTVMINDPVASTHFVVDERNRLFTKDIRGPVSDGPHTMEMTLKHSAEAKASSEGTRVPGFRWSETGENAKTEDLGTQVMEGLSVQGTRTTVTVPAGQMGNERAIEIVSERWFSPDLQIVIMSKRRDPRMGETVYTVTNVSRANPDPALFQALTDPAPTPGTQRTVLKHLGPHEQ